MGRIYLTKEGYQKLKQELKYLKQVKRKEISKALEYARSLGDLSENAEYDAAKEAQALNEKKINEIELKLSGVEIVDDLDISKDEVRIGATVKLLDLETGEEMQYTLVSSEEADSSVGLISVNSPIGRGLLGKREKDAVQISVPAGVLKYRIIKISR